MVDRLPRRYVLRSAGRSFGAASSIAAM